MALSKDALLKRIDELLQGVRSYDFGPTETAFQGAVSLLAALHGPESPQVKQLETARQRMPAGYS